jgi:hypothetical protein
MPTAYPLQFFGLAPLEVLAMPLPIEVNRLMTECTAGMAAPWHRHCVVSDTARNQERAGSSCWMVRRTDPPRERVRYHAFDLPYLDGDDLRDVAYEERKRLLQQLLKDAPETSTYVEALEPDGDQIFAKAATFVALTALHVRLLAGKVATASSVDRSGFA